MSRGPLKRWQRRWKDGWIADMEAPGAWRSAAIDMLVFDHGLLRKAWRNQHQIDTGVWRSNQPDPGMIRRLAARGIRAILNLRGVTEWGSYLLEREACRAHGIDLVDIKLSSREPPPVAKIMELDAIFARIERPFLMHCKSGADRAGLAAALYLLLCKGATADEAREQLSWRYLHFRTGSTGVLHFMLERFGAEAAAEPMPFRDWVLTRYDPDALAAEFRSSRGGDFLVDRVLGRE